MEGNLLASKSTGILIVSQEFQSDEFFFIDSFHDPIMQYVLGGSLHKNNTIYLPLGLYHASVN